MNLIKNIKISKLNYLYKYNECLNGFDEITDSYATNCNTTRQYHPNFKCINAIVCCFQRDISRNLCYSLF